MADKEATVYIIDVGRSMGEKHNGRNESDLEWAMHYVWDKITSTVATGRKTATVGIIGLRTDGTRNELGDDDNYENISVLQEIGQILMPDLRNLRQEIKLSCTEHGDAISALVIAIQMITKYCKKLKYHRKITLVTNGRGSMDPDDVNDIAKKFNEDGMELIVLGVDFDDPEYGFKEEDKDPVKVDYLSYVFDESADCMIKAKNEEVLKALVDGCTGVFGTLEQAVVELGQPRLKSTRPVTSYKGQLTLGDPEQYKSAMCIDVERYPRTMVARAPTASQFVHNSDLSNGQASTQSSATMLVDGDMLEAGQSVANPSGLTSVRNARTYQVDDDDAPGGKRDVDREELAKGYEYGRTAVHISESDENVTKLETKAALEIIGFVPMAKYDRYMNMSGASQIVAQRTNEKAKMAMSSLIHALFELEDYAVARLVARDGRSPVLVLLAPEITPDYECLVDVQLPFAEDFRSYKFPPLDRVVTVSGKLLKEHRNLPSDSLKEAMSNYVDRMDLAAFGTDDEGHPAEYMRMEDTFSPVLHRIDQAVRWRAVHPSEPIPPPYDILTRFSHPPDALRSTATPHLEKLISAASVKKGKSPPPPHPHEPDPSAANTPRPTTVPPKLRSRKRDRQTTTPLSGLDVTTLLSSSHTHPTHPSHPPQISPHNAIPEFKQLLATTEDASTISLAAAQMGKIIESHIAHSVGDSGYGRAVAEMRVLRDELVELEEPEIWNAWVRGLKAKVLGGELGGERREVWWLVGREGLGLVDGGGSALSGVGEGEARGFLMAGR